VDVLEDAADPRGLAVAEDVDVELECTLEVRVHERLLAELELLGAAGDEHAAAAEYVVGADEHRVADPPCDRARLVGTVRRSPGGRANPQLVEQGTETAAVLGTLDRSQRIAEQREARRGHPRGGGDRRLAPQ